MTRTEALRTLADKVEAGAAIPPDFYNVWENYVGDCGDWAHCAYIGSLDAAKALHEAVLPGYWWKVMNGHGPAYVQIGKPGVSVYTGKTSNNLARTWILAIIKALIAEEEVTRCAEFDCEGGAEFCNWIA